ncbi:MAG: ABC transporter substrate-binding protein [Trueperaceae bacterium]|nr:ABC transporter substrate-binding protein [Trueperaceae bacterium]
MTTIRSTLTLLLIAIAMIVGHVHAQPQGDPDAEAFRSAFLAGDLSWDAVLERAAAEGEVVWAHWGGSETLNTWIDTVVRPALAEYGVTLRTSRLTNTRDAVDLVLAEAAAGRGVGQGSIDAIWINGENFFTLSSQGLNFGSFADLVPNSQYFHFDTSNPASGPNLFDFGYPTNREEIPWSGDQYMCAIDTARLERSEAPADFAELEAWLRENPGRFTYVRPPQYNGNTFVQTVLYAHNPDGDGYVSFQNAADALGVDEFIRITQPGYEYLQRIEPFLLGGGGSDGMRGSPIYPEDQNGLEALFVNGEIDMACQFGMYNTAVSIETGRFAETAENVIFPAQGMIKNKNFIGVPINAPNPAAAMVLANVLASPENQISKLGTIGYVLGIDADLLTAEQQAEIDAVAPSLVGITYDELGAVTVPDTNASLVDVIEGTWTAFIERRSGSFEDSVRAAFADR